MERGVDRQVAGRLAAAVGVCAFLGWACTVVVDTDALSEGLTPTTCAADEKACIDPDDKTREICVALSDPDFGCSAETCAPCLLPGALVRCSNRTAECEIAGCDSGHENCDGLDETGCETNLATDEENCGRCGNVCEVEGAASVCASGACVVSYCESGSADCDSRYSNGCEVDLLTDPENCGACETSCSAACEEGVCVSP